MIGNVFVQQYYSIMSTTLDELYKFYNNGSTLHVCGVGVPPLPGADAMGDQTVRTQAGIHARFNQLGYRGKRCEVRTVDSSHSIGGSVVVMVTGAITDGGVDRRAFTQTFVLAPQEGGYYVLNDLVRFLGANEGADAAAAFQALQKAYGILSDPAKRKLFDKTGCTDQDSEAFWEAYQQYRTIYPEVNKEDIAAFAQKYRRSAEEKEDLRAFYTERGGDVSTLQAHIMVSRPEDAARFAAFFDAEIASGALPRTEAYDRTKHLCGQMPEEDDLEGGEDGEDEEEEEVGGEEQEFWDDDGMSDFIVDDESDLGEEEEEENEKNDQGRIVDSKPEVKKRKRGSGAAAPPSAPSSSSSATASSASSTSSSSKKKAKTGKATAAKKKVAKTRKTTKTAKKLKAKATKKPNKKKKKKTSKKKEDGGDDGMDSLRAMMLQRARNRHESMMDVMAAKYG